ncbi:MAG: response regulator [Sphingobacteriaceae bacterium]|nr:response regulator [Sphingobacteriaceae bacterium]
MKKLNCILLVDDDISTNFLHKKILQKAEVAEEILVALNGKEAIDYLAGNYEKSAGENPQPDLILLDINMPLMDGWEFLNEYKNLEMKKDAIIIVMLTTSLNPDDRLRAETIPEISGFQSKPLSFDMLTDILEDHF